jgi:hypothetical protein
MNKNKKSVELAKYFVDKTGLKVTVGYFKTTIGIASNLLTVYTLEQLKEGVDYYVNHPPRNGFHSLGWLSFGMNEALVKKKIEDAKKIEFHIDSEPETNQEDNYLKYASTRKAKIKGCDV